MGKHGVNRRTFLGSALAAGASVWAAPRRASAAGSSLKGFIVSDAHFGWDNAQQPAPAVQREMMARIVKRFPDLDLFFDTGDAHHGDLRGEAADEARADWTETILEAGFNCPFFYVTGNHDGMTTHSEDSEWRCAELGSLVCRPYYSFTVKNIHFVSLPQLMRTVYLNREAMEWLALDLEVHKRFATVILSHNNIIGTTGPYEAGYRGVVNCEALLEALDKHGNVFAWMHGHNHNYEVVKKHDRLYVSNGRIGGFDPSRNNDEGSHGLGGIYFEIDAEGLTVRSWSAERETFLDEAGINGVSGRLDKKTNYEQGGSYQFHYGMGGARNGQRIPLYTHMPGDQRKFYMKPEPELVMNDDPEATLMMTRNADKPKKAHKQLMGSDVLAPKQHWDHANPGITLHARDAKEEVTTVSIPQRGMGEACYYAVAPGMPIEVNLAIEAGPGGQHVTVRAEVFDRDTVSRGSVEVGDKKLEPGVNQLHFQAELPENREDTVYADAASDNVTHVMLLLAFCGLSAPVTLRRVELLQTVGKTVTPALVLNGRRYETHEAKGMRSMFLPPAQAREVIEVSATGRVSWIMDVVPIAQVLNAPAHAPEWGQFIIGPPRNRWSRKETMIVTTLQTPGYRKFTVTFNHVRLAEMREDGKVLSLRLREISQPATVRIAFRGEDVPRNILGADSIAWEGNTVTLGKKEPGVIELK